jgi:tetratricopeptide (TPR) repeat protein
VAADGGKDRWARVRRWATSLSAIIAALGIVSAGIGYVTSGVQFFVDIGDYFEGQSELKSLIAAADERLARADFDSAWQTNAKARQLAPKNAEAAAQQARIAMKWLENVQLSTTAGPRKFSDVVDPLKSVLIERLAGAQGREKADLHAHIGWANFLRARDGHPPAAIAEEFEAALREDPDNLYGRVMRGFWVLWTRGPLDKARTDFDVALRSNVDPAFSDGLIMSALTNSTSDAFVAGAIEFANKIRKAGRNISDAQKATLIWYYSTGLRSSETLLKISAVLPADEQIAFLDWLRQADTDDYRKRTATYAMAVFAERAGRKDEALQHYTTLVSTSPGAGEDLTRLSQEAVGRLQQR